MERNWIRHVKVRYIQNFYLKIHVLLFQPPLLRQINEATGKSNELRLKVRSLTGSTIYLIHITADESVTKLYELLDKAMQTSAHSGYKVVLSG